MVLKASLRNRPVIYEIVPPRRDTSRFNTELRGIEDVLHDPRIAAINIPELTNRTEQNGGVVYSPATIPPEEYWLLIRELKEGIVNMVAPRLERGEFLRRAHSVLHEYGIPNLVVVGKERRADVLPGPSVLEALRLLREEKGGQVSLGGIAIFGRESPATDGYGSGSSVLTEPRRVWYKGKAGCDFVTSQITFDAKPVLRFLSSYQTICEETGTPPLTVFISLTTVPTRSILSLLEGLDVVIPSAVHKKLVNSGDMGRESLRIATEVFQEIVGRADRYAPSVPLGLQIEQIGVNNDALSLSLLDSTCPILKTA